MERIIKDWKINALPRQKETRTFLEGTGVYNSKAHIHTLYDLHKEAFSKIDCLLCANCCRTTPPIIREQDAKRIAKFLGRSVKQFTKEYLVEDYNGEVTMNGVPCRFLNTDNSCAIYDIRPEACRRYPHTDEPEYFRRPKLNAANTVVCPAAYYIAEKLKSILS